MKQVKVITVHTESLFESVLNSWLMRNHNKVEVVDIKFAIIQGAYSAMIIYETK